MGMIRSPQNLTGLQVGAITLGLGIRVTPEGVALEPGQPTTGQWWGWIHQDFATGVVEADGSIIPDEISP